MFPLSRCRGWRTLRVSMRMYHADDRQVRDESAFDPSPSPHATSIGSPVPDHQDLTPSCARCRGFGGPVEHDQSEGVSCLARCSRLVVALLVACQPGSRSAQTGAGTIAGIVRDSSGGAIPGATVHIVNEDSGAGVDATSDGQGAYRAAALAPGRYRVEATLDGFEAVTEQVVARDRADRRRST